MSLNDLTKLVSSGESETIEFKKTTGQLERIGEVLCAFLNGSGGRVLIGIADNGKIIGLTVKDKTLREIANTLSKLEPAVNIEIIRAKVNELNEVVILEAHPVISLQPFAFAGRPYERVGSTTSIMPRTKYQQLIFRANYSTARWEKEIALNYVIDDLNTEEIQYAYQSGVNAGRIPEMVQENSPYNILNRFGLIDKDRLLNAAVVLFGKRFLPDFPQCQLKLALFKGKTKAIFLDQKQLHGNAFYLVNEAALFLHRHLSVSSEIVPESLERKDKMLPFDALREALVNAICHRSYEQPGGAVSIAIFEDRLEISNSGVLPADIKLEDLKKDHASHPRNPIIANVFFRRGLIEQWGRGTQRITELCNSAGHPEPEFEEQTGSLIVRFFFYSQNKPYEAISENLSDRQHLIIKLLSQQEQLTFFKIKSLVPDPPKDRTLRDDLQRLKKLGKIQVSGMGRGARWQLIKS